jgi:hypothetical protein
VGSGTGLGGIGDIGGNPVGCGPSALSGLRGSTGPMTGTEGSGGSGGNGCADAGT